MILTEYLKKHFMESASILTKEDFDYIDKVSFKDRGKTLNNHISNIDNTTLFFKRGIIIFTFTVLDDDGFDNERVCIVHYLYKNKKETTLDWNEWFEDWKRFVKLNGCNTILMYTELSPNFWIRGYGFKIRTYEMELKL